MAGLRTSPFWQSSPHVAMVEAQHTATPTYHLHAHPSLHTGGLFAASAAATATAATTTTTTTTTTAATAATANYYYYYYYCYCYHYYYYCYYQAQLDAVAAELMRLSPLDAPWDDAHSREGGAGASALGTCA